MQQLENEDSAFPQMLSLPSYNMSSISSKSARSHKDILLQEELSKFVTNALYTLSFITLTVVFQSRSSSCLTGGKAKLMSCVYKDVEHLFEPQFD